MIDDTECCSQRIRIEKAPSKGIALFPSPESQRHAPIRRCDPSNVHALPDCFFTRLAQLCCDDPHIASRIEDDRTCPLIWGKAHSLRFLFLQMCIRDKHAECIEIWPKLMEFERREYLSAVQHGPPSRDFFLDIMVTDEQCFREPSDCGSSEAGRSDSSHASVSSYASITSIFYG